jgi:phosphate transport system permease protein
MVIFSLLMLAGMIGLIVVKGLGHFWPQELIQITTASGDTFLAEVSEHETAPAAEDGKEILRTKYEIGSRDVYALEFRWIDDSAIVTKTRPDSAVAFERTANGDMFAYLASLHDETGEIAIAPHERFARLVVMSKGAARTAGEIRSLEEQIAQRYRPLNEAGQLLGAARLPQRLETAEGVRRADQLKARADSIRAALQPKVEALHERIEALRAVDRQRFAAVRLADGTERSVALSEIVRAWQPNRMSFGQKAGHYAMGLWSFVSDPPREANTGGGILPAIYGTVLMVLLMTIAVVPLGVVSALYLHEYARDTWFLRAVRLAVNNLAGVPSIVFGVFGLGFFIYFVGAGIDRAFFSEYLPSPTFGTGGILWASLTLSLLTVPVVIVATEEGLAAVPRAYREGSLALGATKFQTIRKIVIPYAMPGILTGVILAVSRGAGEVAPLMVTGVVPLVSDYPITSEFPFLYLNRKFMHLGFHVYDVGFQSPNVEAVKPLVYSTTFVLIVLVVLLNATAIILRNRLRGRFKGSTV